MSDDDLLAGLNGVDRTKCALCGRSLGKTAHLVNIDDNLVSICQACYYFRQKKRKQTP